MNQISRCKPYLGTFIEVSIQADCDSLKLIEVSNLAFDVIHQVHESMSFHNQDSELSHINQNAHNQPVVLSDMLFDVLSFAKQLHIETDGVFDVSMVPWMIRDGFLPAHNSVKEIVHTNLAAMLINNNSVFFEKPLLLDLGGIAKGYAIDCAMKVIVETINGPIEQVSINAGGDMKVYNWQAFETLIPDKIKTMHTIPMKNTALASSSSYYLAGKSAIYDISTGLQVEIPATISVYADQCMVADALTKVVAVLGIKNAVYEKFNAEVVLT